MSPPCVNTIFEGDNGGATSVGVTSTEISVAFPHNGWCNGADCQAMFTALFDFFNQRFEFYGRRLKPVFVSGSHNDPSQARALAAQVASQNVFGAVTTGVEWNNVDPAMFQELARSHVITVMRGTNAPDRTLFDDLHPYLWSTHPSSEQWQQNMAAFACASLAGRPASHAKAESLRSQTRKIGVISAGQVAVPNARTLVKALQDCGIETKELSWSRRGDSGAQQLRTGIEAFRSAGVTTVTCVCTGWMAADVLLDGVDKIADFGPEVLTPMFSEPSDEWWTYTTSRQSMFGITARPKLLPLQAQSWHQAMVAMAPELIAKLDYNATNGTKLTYELLLVMAAGIQGAGPHLTPETFAAALMSMKFPNAGSGAAPYWQPAVGFGPGDHSFIDDYAVTWWSDNAPTVEILNSKPTGSWCYLGQGNRWSVGRFPSDLDGRLFAEEPCR